MRYICQHKINQVFYDCGRMSGDSHYYKLYKYIMHPINFNGHHFGTLDLQMYRKGYITCRLKKK